MTDTAKETLKFDAEVSQLLHLVTHALYSNSEIFLRELVSNASDASDKLRYEAIEHSDWYEDDPELKIWLTFDKEHQLLTIRDNGIGMSREEVIENLGTIAQSGTKAFKSLLDSKDNADSQLIGQFGVGFYSTFIVADRVVVRTRRAGVPPEQGVYWESDGQGEYVVETIKRKLRGTEVVLHLKDSAVEFLDHMRLRTVIRKYSDHIALPIMMNRPETEEQLKQREAGEIVVPDEEVVNQANALWSLDKSAITDEQYQELYKHIAHDFDDPLAWTHNKVEGKTEYTSLLYIPKRAPMDLWDREHQRGLKLYVKRVFIMDDAEHLMPQYFRFVKGVVDSSDLPLNISREILQSDKKIVSIKSGCVKRVFSLLERLANQEPEQYAVFWDTFGQVLKEGVGEDFANKDRIADLLRFYSTQDNGEACNVTLKGYIERMKEGQDRLYYLIADTLQAALSSPLLEMFRAKGIEVLLLCDRVDEWFTGNLTEFEGKVFQSISGSDVDLGDLEDAAEKEEKNQAESDFKTVIDKIKQALGERVQEVRITHRLTDSPACVVFDNQGLSGHMQRMLKMAGQNFNESRPILELNPKHPIVMRVKAEEDAGKLTQWSELLYCQAMLAEGESLNDPSIFIKSVNGLLVDLM